MGTREAFPDDGTRGACSPDSALTVVEPGAPRISQHQQLL